MPFSPDIKQNSRQIKTHFVPIQGISPDIVDLHDSNVSEKLLFAKLVREDRDLGNKKFYYGLKPSALGINHI